MPTDPLTASQARVLAYIRDFIAQRGLPPTHAEIARGLGFRSATAAAQHVRALARRGAISILPRVARGIRLVDDFATSAASPSTLPVIGEVAAGDPILASAHVERTVPLSPTFFSPRADYLLRVRGESMIDAGILPRDLVAVHRTDEVADGAVAVVRLEDEVTVKRWRRKGTKVILEPANADLSPRIVDPVRTRVAIEGRVVGLLRVEAFGGTMQ